MRTTIQMLQSVDTPTLHSFSSSFSFFPNRTLTNHIVNGHLPRLCFHPNRAAVVLVLVSVEALQFAINSMNVVNISQSTETGGLPNELCETLPYKGIHAIRFRTV